MKYSQRFTSKNMNTSAIFGFVNTLEEILRKETPTHIAVCFDPAGKTFRHEMFDGYKAGREATPEDIRIAIPYIKDIIRAYRIPVIEVDGYEADDVIGTLAVKSRAYGFSTFIMSPDKDLGQLVDETVKIYRPGYKGQPAEVRGIKEIRELFGIDEPKQIIDLLALMGDKVDNIAGCPGVGEKTASKLISEFGSVEQLVANTDKLRGSLREKVAKNVDNILFSKKLATICTDVPIDFDEEAMARKPMDEDRIRALFEELEFRSLLARVLGEKTATPAPAVKKAEPKIKAQGSLFDELLEPTPEASVASRVVSGRFTLADESTLAALVDKAIKGGKCGICVVSENEDAMRTHLAGVAVAIADGEAFYVAVPDDDSMDFARPELQRLFGDRTLLKAGNDWKRSIIVLHRNGIHISEPYYDNAIAHYLLQPEMNHGLDRLSEIYLSETLPEVVVPEGVKANKFDMARDLQPDAVCPVACGRACANFRLHPVLDAMVAEKQMSHLLNDIEFPLVAVLADMEMAGVRIDVPTLQAYSVTLTQRMENIEKECMELAGKTFNASSPAQVGEVLFEHLNLDPRAKRSGSRGQYSTTEEILEKLRSRHPIVGKILEFRKVKKLLSTYVNALPELINPETGKIHTTFNQTVTATGRLSSTNPNLQNIPIRNDEGREIRKAFIPDEGHVFFSADYSQIELRIVANISGDEAMVGAFLAGDDIHRATAAKIFHESIADVTDDQRRKAKTANFGMIYGISTFGLAERLQIPRQEAKEIIEGYFRTFPGVQRFMEESIERTRHLGYVTTLFGRHRLLPDINSRNAVVRGYAERNAINAPVQGTAADIIKIAMVRIHKRFEEEGIRSKMIIQVHDELNFDVLPEELEQVRKIVKEEMEGAYSATVPLVADCGSGSNWLEAH